MPKRFKQFSEFVTDKDKGKAPVKKIADYTGPIPNKPPGGGSPYAATGKGGKASKGAKVGSDWTEKGDKSLVYKPKTDQEMSDKGTAKCVDSVKEFVDATKGMSPSQFAKYISENSANVGIAHESIHQVCKILAENPQHTADLVRELNRKELLPLAVASAFSHPEGYKTVVAMMENSVEFCRKLVNAMNEMVGPPAHHMGMGHPAAGGSLGMGDDGTGIPPTPGQDPSGMGAPHPLDPHASPDGDDDIDDIDDGDGLGDEDFDDEDDLGINDEDMDGMGDPTQGAAQPGDHHHHHHGAGLPKPPMGMGGPPPQDMPKPSMMARMMAREGKTPAFSNFLKALQG